MRVALFAALVLAVASFGAQAAPATKGSPAISIKGQMLMQADEADYDIDNAIVTARGHVEIDSDGRVLLADEVSYDQKKDVTTASGHVTLTDEKGNVSFSDHVVLTDHMRDGVLRSFAALLGKSGRLVASGAIRTEGRFTEAFDAGYTPCKICNQPGQRTPVWKVEAAHVVYDQVKHRIVFRNAIVSFLGVPMFYSPYLSQPDPTVRYASGILMPDIGNSTYIGYFTRIPVYVSLSDSNDMTLTPTFSTRGGEVLEGEYRERWNGGGMWLQASIADNPNGSKLLPDGAIKQGINQGYGSLFGEGHIPIDSIWHAGFDAQLTSNDTYLKRYDFSQLDRLVNDLFVEADGGRTRFAVTGYFFQGLQANDNSKVIPLALPLIEFSYSPLKDWAGGQFRFDFNTVTLTRDIGLDAQRATAEARMKWPTILPGGQMLTVQADVRGDLYHVSNDVVNGPDRFISRGIPYVALDWRWPFISQTRPGHAFIVEPIVQGVLQPYGGNPAGIPNDDSADFELDDNNILSFDQLPGYDLVESGPRMNVGLHARAVFPQGSVDAILGQTYRLKPDPIFALDSGQNGTSSDVVGRVSIKFLPYIDLTDRIDVDRGNGTVRRHEVYLTALLGRTTLQLSYVQLPCTLNGIANLDSVSTPCNADQPTTIGLPEREEINAQADVNFYKNWQAFGAIRRDLLAGQTLDSELGLGYEDECFGVSVAYRRKYTSDRDLPPSTDIVFRFKLKTGDEPIEPFSLFPQDVFSRP